MQRLGFLCGVLLILFVFGEANAVALTPVYVNCNTDTLVRPSTISGNVGDTLDVIVTGSCADYRLSPSSDNVAISNPLFGSVLTNQTATITLTAGGTGLLYVYNTDPPSRGKSFTLQVTGSPPFTVSGSFLNFQDGTQLRIGPPIGLFLVAFNGTTVVEKSFLQTLTSYSFTVPRNSRVVAWALSTNYYCGIAGGLVINGLADSTINPADSWCNYLPPEAEFDPLAGILKVYVKRSGEVSSNARSLTSSNQLPDAPVTYRGVCTSTDGGVQVTGTASSADWNAPVTIDLSQPTIGKTYTCSVESEATMYGYTYQSGLVAVENNPIKTALPTPPPNPIPTLSEWAQMAMMLLMLVTAGWYGRRIKQP